MAARHEVLELVYDCIRDINRTREANAQVSLSDTAVLLGSDGGLDSLALVSLIVDVEQRANERFGASVILANERAMSRQKSPFRTVATLCDYLTELLKGSSSSEQG